MSSPINPKYTNPQYRFYGLLLELFWDGLEATRNQFNQKLAQKIVALAEAHPDKITLTGISSSNLEQWFEWKEADSSVPVDEWSQVRKTIITHCFADLGQQMRNPHVRRIYFGWAWYGDRYFEGIRIHVRKVVDLGDGITAITLVTNRPEWVRNYSGEPDRIFDPIVEGSGPDRTDDLYMTVAEKRG